MPKNLLDLDRVPTLEELRAFFKANDFSAAVYKDIDYGKMDAEEIEDLEYIKNLMDKHWQPLAREMGLKADPGYYGKDNPLIAMGDSLENLAATGVLKLVQEQPERAEEILAQFDLDGPDSQKHADDFLHNAVKTLMQTADYPALAAVVQSDPAYEDFNHEKYNNYRAKDFDRKWNHTRAAITVSSLEEMQENALEDGTGEEVLQDTRVDVEQEVVAKMKSETFWDSISPQDKQLLKLRMQGMSQVEIAKALGYKTHSAVTKRLKLKEVFKSIYA